VARAEHATLPSLLHQAGSVGGRKTVGTVEVPGVRVQMAARTNQRHEEQNMSHQNCSRSGYTVEWKNEDEIWKTLYPPELVSKGDGIPLGQYEHDAWINAMLRVMSYEAAVAMIAVIKANSFQQALCVKYRIRRWDVTYELKAVETDDTADFVDNLFTK
jgi:hypothetical protein